MEPMPITATIAAWKDRAHDLVVEGLRDRLVKNFLLTLFISRGVPMLLGGDEFRRTQRGNNNAYSQDNETSWFDWGLLEKHRGIQRFARGMIAFRKAHPVLRKEDFYADPDINARLTILVFLQLKCLSRQRHSVARLQVATTDIGSTAQIRRSSYERI